EFEDAINSYRQRKSPDILTYFKHTPVMASLEDDAELELRRAQKRMVEDFVQRWFEDKQAGTFKAASHPFQAVADFEDILETHLRELILKHIGEPPPIPPSESPFRGLEAFEIEHAPIFFGRSRARNELREVLVRQASRGCAFVLVFGASGSGKSSLVKAGLLPDLMMPGMVKNVGLCRVALMRPSDNSEDPFAALGAALLRKTDQSKKKEAPQVMALPELADLAWDKARLASHLCDASNALLPIEQGLQAAHKKAKLADHADARLTIVVDQLEELFTTDYSDENRQRFIGILALFASSGRVWVIATMRSDFFDRLAKLPELVKLSQGEGRYLLMPPNEAEIGQIIRQPAQEAGLQFETDDNGISLDEKLREAAGKNPSALPLLEFTLEQLWQECKDTGVLSYEAYDRLGGMEGALGQRAEEVFKDQPEEVQQALPKVLRALVTIGQEEHAAATTKTAQLDTFPEGTPQRELVEAFLDWKARLLTVGEGDQVRISHEALLSHWSRAAAQIRTDRQDLQTRARVEAAAALWVQMNKSKAFLLTQGKPLADGEDFLAKYRDELDPQITAFIRASSARARRKKLMLVAVAAGFAALGILAIIGAFIAVNERERALQALRVAVAWEYAEKDPEYSVVFLRETSDTEQIRGWRGATSNVLEKYGIDNRHPLIGHETKIVDAKFSPDGIRVVTGSRDKTARLWTLDGNPLGALMKHTAVVLSVDFSPDGRLVYTASLDGTAQIWDAATGKPVVAPLQHRAAVTSISSSPDGSVVLTTSSDGEVHLWNTKDGSPAAGSMKHGGRIHTALFSQDGKSVLIISQNGAMEIRDRDFTKVQPMFEGKSPVVSAGYSADGKWIFSATKRGAVRIWDSLTFKLALEIRSRGLTAASISPDGSRIVTGSKSGHALIWRFYGGIPEVDLLHEKGVTAASFSPDSRRVLTASEDGKVGLWNLDGILDSVFDFSKSRLKKVDFSPDGSKIVVVSWDGRAEIVDVLPEIEILKKHLWKQKVD
ncbi:MAG: WD40 repeat domain-containing protein, partial [Deltaproteobacteria bacterium]|nr:WD40 repeat domain-containing protein [Deltaproteobacteria bacterium]